MNESILSNEAKLRNAMNEEISDDRGNTCINDNDWICVVRVLLATVE